MIKKIKQILNTYTDEELDDIELWFNSRSRITNILIDENNIDLISEDSEIKINDMITKERNN